MRLKFKLCCPSNWSTNQFFNLNEIPADVGEYVKFSLEAQKTLGSTADDKLHKITAFHQSTGYHYLVQLDEDKWYDCAWLFKKTEIKHL